MESKIEKFGFDKDPLIKTYEEAKLEKKINEIIDHLNSQDQEEENTVCEGCGKTITSRFMQSYTKGDGMHSYCLSCDPEKQDTPEEITAEQLCEDNRKRMERLINKEMEERGFIRKIKDTPEEINPYEKITKEYARAFAKDEEKEDIKRLREDNQDTPEQTESDVQEWEKKWEEFFLYVTNDKNWVDGRPEWKGNVYITLYNATKDFIKNLLLERERWAIDTFLKDTASYNSFHNGRPRTMRNGLSGEGFEIRVSKLNKKK